MGKNFGVMYTTRIVWDFASGLRIAKNEWEGLLQKKKIQTLMIQAYQ